ncbi:Crp/Fnr family transcriptional regulator [Ramlibacter albus]|uniref:Cyclic nucleotide-binding domain-containing protein n=1 Tax=Ramlibacter albus TaxID=2079448 RepID=A0A923M7A7_9BURK|nr:cyclic nucleotide-binding domain-containing protein [Ramlibacter albus]MBC5765300.1 cyclic nucleotide-binding domain-containing protein [Ramlibacter albus]
MSAKQASKVADLSALVTATRKNRGRDSLEPFFSETTWRSLAGYVVQRKVKGHTLLIEQGATERSMYFIESGLLRVFRSDKTSRVQLAVLGAGSVVGEGTFFAPIVRNASVEAAEPTVLWELTPETFAGLAEENAKAALEISMGLGCVLSVRMLSVAGRMAIT